MAVHLLLVRVDLAEEIRKKSQILDLNVCASVYTCMAFNFVVNVPGGCVLVQESNLFVPPHCDGNRNCNCILGPVVPNLASVLLLEIVYSDKCMTVIFSTYII